MEQQQTFSPGLLYSVAPESFSELHLRDEARPDEFDWEEYESQLAGDSFAQDVINFLKISAVKWGLVRR